MGLGSGFYIAPRTTHLFSHVVYYCYPESNRPFCITVPFIDEVTPCVHRPTLHIDRGCHIDPNGSVPIQTYLDVRRTSVVPWDGL